MPEETPASKPPRPTERLARLEEEVAILTEVVLAREDDNPQEEPAEPEKTTIEEREPDPTDPPAEEEADAEPEQAAPTPAHRPGILW